MNNFDRINFEEPPLYFQNLQKKIISELETLDSKKFEIDTWQTQKSRGITSVIADGSVFEKGAVNYSHIKGNKLPPSASNRIKNSDQYGFEACGISIVIHPNNPFVPTSHANLRFFVIKNENEIAQWWFGGGYDLTPYYANKEDCIYWHTTAANTCNQFGEDLYPRFKKQCDDYFYLKHRNEHRGVGGLFFDDLNSMGFDNTYEFVQTIGQSYIDAYLPIVEKRKDTVYENKHKEFQLYRRGRYVEFNLLFDRGTLFGIQSNGRTESILVSMPPQVKWTYQYQPQENSPEAELTNFYLKPQDWLNQTN